MKEQPAGEDGQKKPAQPFLLHREWKLRRSDGFRAMAPMLMYKVDGVAGVLQALFR